MKRLVMLCSVVALQACTVVNYQAIARSPNGAINISGAETSFMSNPKAIVLECASESKSDYVCEKHYPGDTVDLFANMSMKR